MSLKTDDLDRVYGARSPAETRALYDGWAGSYDAEIVGKGYCLPALAAGLVARHAAADGTVLDAGCGTGRLGAALGVLGFRSVVGLDLSEGMVAAASRLGVYERLYVHRLGEPIPEPDGAFAAVACTGSFGPGHAPPESLAEFVRVTRPGGHVIFNLVEASREEQGFPAVMDRLAAEGRWRERERTGPARAFLLAEPELLVRLFVFEVL